MPSLQPYVEHAKLADKLLVLGKKERQLYVLQCQRKVSLYDVCPYVIGIVLSHQS